MHTEVFNNIDLLINMADSDLSLDDINTELITLNKNIKRKNEEIEDLKSTMVDSKYFNEASKLVDKNIEISLKNKINRLNRKLKEIDFNNSDVKSREKAVYQDITNLKEQLEANKKYVDTIKEKVSSSEYFHDLVVREENNVHDLEEELNNKQKLYDDILAELELNNQALKEINDKLEVENNRLCDVSDNLDNPNSYIDLDLKKEDESKLENLEKELENLEKRKIELLTNAEIIGADAKELIINNDLKGALNKIKELVTIVKSKPYMDIKEPNILEEELEKKESLRSELATLIDNKNYEESDTNLINKRINYLKESLESNKEQINDYNNLSQKIQNRINNSLSMMISEVEEKGLRLEKNITEYRTLLKDKSKNIRIKANLENVLTKKEKERSILNDLLASYKDDLMGAIKEMKSLEELIDSLNKENVSIEAEINKLGRLSLLDIKVKDLVLEEEDKERLKQVNEEIKAIKNRQKYNRSADEIYDEIDMGLALNKEDKTVNIQDQVNNMESNLNQIDSMNTDGIKIKVVNMFPVEAVKSGG